jgi:hypothetical protein
MLRVARAAFWWVTASLRGGRDESWSYLRSTVVEVRLPGGLDVDGGVDVTVVVTAARAVTIVLVPMAWQSEQARG